MRLLRDMEPGELPPTCVAVGVFDGVHVGHQAVLRAAVAKAAELKVLPTALTFDPHPDLVLRPERAPMLLTTIAERAELVAETGIEAMVVARFDRALAGLAPEQFVEQVLLGRLSARCVTAGEGFVFGHGAQGNVKVLTELGERLGFCVIAVPRVEIDGMGVSSTRVRQLISAGDIERATALLGHHYIIGGRVVHGDRRGRTLGAPTANVCVEEWKLLPANGVYAMWVRLEGAAKRLAAVANIGVRPTFADEDAASLAGVPCVEAHIIEEAAPPDLYGRALTLEVVARLREERAFPSAEALARQIREDVVQAREILSRGRE